MIKKIIIASLALIAVNCNEMNDEDPNREPIDPKLIGDWYVAEKYFLFDSVPINGASGYRFEESRKLRKIGVDFSSGALALMDNKYDSILFAKDGKAAIIRDLGLFNRIDTINYILGGDLLEMTIYGTKKMYQRGNVGNKIYYPIQNSVSAKVDGYFFQNLPINKFLSAFAIRNNANNSFKIASFGEATFCELTINNFSGCGNYQIGGFSGNNAIISIYYRDVILMYETNDSSFGSIIIESIDETNLRTYGKFLYNAYLSGYYDSTAVVTVTEGEFSVPLYYSIK